MRNLQIRKFFAKLSKRSALPRASKARSVYSLAAIGLIAGVSTAGGVVLAFSNDETQPLSSQNRNTEIHAEARKLRQDSLETRDKVRAAEGTRVESNTTNSQTTVTINDKSVSVPQNGSFSQTFRSDDGSSKIDVSVRNQSSSSADGQLSSSRSNVTIHSDVRNEERRRTGE